jgi:hypothetical protein
MIAAWVCTRSPPGFEFKLDPAFEMKLATVAWW